MSLRYTGPKGDYPVYCCRADRDHKAGPLCQEARALAIDAFVERTFLDALAPDRIAIAVAALGQLQEEAHRLEKQWAWTSPLELEGLLTNPRHPRREGWRRGEPDGASRGSSRRRR